jgi:hypothetical protein
MSKALKFTFLIHAFVSLVLGLPLLLAPGRFLILLGWIHIDTMTSRVLGAALLALAWSSWRGWQAQEKAQVSILLELEVTFTVLAALGLLRELVFFPFPPIYWLVFIILALFAVAWSFFSVQEMRLAGDRAS